MKTRQSCGKLIVEAVLLDSHSIRPNCHKNPQAPYPECDPCIGRMQNRLRLVDRVRHKRHLRFGTETREGRGFGLSPFFC